MRRFQHRQGDLEKLLGFGGAIHLGRLIKGLGDGLQAGQQQSGP